jgi:tetratricopeptide (TPR) repeat protein
MALGDLPIALEMAGALVAQQGVSYRFYLRQFEQLWAELLDTDHRSAAHPSAVAMAWELSYRHLRSAEPVAADLLALASYLSTDDVRLSLLHGGSNHATYPLAPVLADPIRLSQVADVLAKYSLAEFDERSLRLHGATASMARTRLPDEDQQVWARVAMRVATGAFTYRPDDATSRRAAAEVLPHVMAAASHVDHLGLDPSAVARALTDAGQFFYECGQFARSRDTFERAMEAARQAYGEGHPKIAALSDRLARAMVRAGEFEKAREHFERAIEMDAAKYGYNDPHVATLVNNYGRYHFAKRDYATARQQYEWARTVLEGHYGAEHQRVAAVINNIGYVHGTEGDLAKAREHLEKALAIAERTYPEGHPDVARISGNLGRVAQAQGERNVARALLEKALVIDRAAQGYEHPDTVRDYVYLGDLLMEAGQFTSAGEHYRQAMNSAEAAFGLYHAAVVCCLEKLAAAQDRSGDAGGARWARDRAEAIKRSVSYEAPAAAPTVPTAMAS